MSNLNEDRMKRFRDMGIPQPMAPVDPSSVQGPVRNTAFAAKLAALKGGALKEEITTFVDKQEANKGFVPLEVPSKNKGILKEQKPGAPVEKLKTLPTSGPSFDVYEKALYGDNTPSSSSFEKASVPGRNYSSDMLNEGETGNEFLSSIKARLQEKAARAANGQTNTQIQIPNQKPINDNQLIETVTQISTDVCKQLIKKFMSEFLTSEPGLIKENEKIKKAEIVKEDIIKMDGKYFKITPVSVKKK
jgi:hypothetical protein